jgi:hypothetical protein
MKTVDQCKSLLSRKLMMTLLTVAFAVSTMTAQAVTQQGLNDDDVIKMVAAHLSDNTIVQMIQSQPGDYSLSPDSLGQLKQHGVQEAVINAMRDKTSSASPGASTSTSLPPQAVAPGSTSASAIPGVVRIGIVMPKVQLGAAAQSPTAGESLRTILGQYLTGPGIEVVSISALLPQQIASEAQTKQCNYLVYSSLTEKKGGGMGFLKSATTIARFIPMVGGIASAAATIATATTAAQEAATLSGGITAKSQLAMEYHVTAPGATSPLLSNTRSAKATADGEDILTPLVEQEALDITAALPTRPN